MNLDFNPESLSAHEDTNMNKVIQGKHAREPSLSVPVSMLPSLEQTFVGKDGFMVDNTTVEKFPETDIKGLKASDIGHTEKESSLKGAVFVDFQSNEKDSVFNKLNLKMREQFELESICRYHQSGDDTS